MMNIYVGARALWESLCCNYSKHPRVEICTLLKLLASLRLLNLVINLKIFVLKISVLFKSFTHVQLLTTCVENTSMH